jgi:hypothetical protein
VLEICLVSDRMSQKQIIVVNRKYVKCRSGKGKDSIAHVHAMKAYGVVEV